MNQQTSTKFLLSALFALGLGATVSLSAHASSASEITPEVTANVWEENNLECAAVTLNGRDLLTYKGHTAKGEASDKAEEIADKLEEIFEDDKIDPEKILPAREGELAVIRVDGNAQVKFEVPESVQGQKSSGALETSLKVVNVIREALGGSQLPPSFLKIADAVQNPQALRQAKGNIFSGCASWYGGRFHGRKTSYGSRFDQFGKTAAHRSLPFGTKLLVFNRRTGDSCVVEVNDRGPFVADRVIDLSRGAAEELNMISSGVAMVDCIVLEQR
ncbi:MAG TPA: septal ring lytic transglycosylase RlpA family protein [Candidatus Obscuribacterales bacterium]